MADPNTGQVDAVLRHVYTAGGTAITIMGALALLPDDQVQPAVDALHKMGDAAKEFFGAASVLWGIIGPVIVGLAMKGAWFAASMSSRVRALFTVASGTSPQASVAKVAIVNAAAQLPEVEKVVAPALAESPATAANVTSK